MRAAVFAILLVASAAAAQPRWYEPSAEDEKASWNHHDAWWGGYRHASLVTGFHSFFLGPLNVVGLTGGEAGVRVGTEIGAITVTSYFPNRSLSVGLDLVRGYGTLLHDFGLPDVQLGVLWPDVEVRYIFGNGVSVLSEGSGLTGLRLTAFDLLRVELRAPVVTVWTSTGLRATWAVSWGGALDVGVEF